MDLVAGVRKEGSRGGRDAFKWEDVKDDQHRENYLGHSLMAPVGRWQKNKDLSWYAKGDNSQAATDAANARKEEIRRIKEAEQDALSEALGFKVEPRLREHQVAGSKEVQRAIKETADDDDELEEGGKGLGFGGFAGGGVGTAGGEEGERMLGYIGNQGGLEGGREKREKRRRRSRSRDKRRRREDRERDEESSEKRIRDNHDGRGKERYGERYHRHRSRSREYGRRRRDDDRYRRERRERSYSPHPRQRERSRDRSRDRKRR